MPAGWLDKRNARLLAEAEEAIRTETKESQQFKVNQAQQREAIRRDPDQADGWGVNDSNIHSECISVDSSNPAMPGTASLDLTKISWVHEKASVATNKLGETLLITRIKDTDHAGLGETANAFVLWLPRLEARSVRCLPFA